MRALGCPWHWLGAGLCGGVTGAGVALGPRCCTQHISPVSTLALSPSCETCTTCVQFS